MLSDDPPLPAPPAAPVALYPAAAPRHRPLFTQGPVGRGLLRLTLPQAAGMLATIGFMLVDALFVGMLGTQPLAALGFVLPVVFIVSSIGMGLGIGAASVLARLIGAGRREAAAGMASHALLLALLCALAGAALGLATIEPLFRLLGAGPALLPLIRAYMEVWYWGLPFLFLPMVGNSMVRAAGDAVFPGVMMIVTGLVNVVLDPLLIFGWGPVPALGIAGAAWAGVAGRAVMCLGTVLVLWRRERLLTVPALDPAALAASWRPVLAVGLPAILAQAAAPLGTAIITGVIAWFGTAAVAGFALGVRIEALTMSGIYALSICLGPFVGQNQGGGRPDRVARALVLSWAVCLVTGLVMALGLWLGADALVRLLHHDPAVQAAARWFLWLAPAGYCGTGIVLVTAAALNGLGEGARAGFVSVARVFVLLVPLALAGGLLGGVVGAFAGIALGNLVAGAAALVLAWPVVRPRDAVGAPARALRPDG